MQRGQRRGYAWVAGFAYDADGLKRSLHCLDNNHEMNLIIQKIPGKPTSITDSPDISDAVRRGLAF